MSGNSSRSAFTLIEIVIAISLIGLFVTVPILAYSSYLRKGRDIKRKNDINQIQVALEQYKARTGAYPGAYDLQDLVTFGFLPTIPKDPVDGQPIPGENGLVFKYAYTPSENLLNYQLLARLESSNVYYQSTPTGNSEIKVSPGTGMPLVSTPIPINTVIPSYSPVPTRTLTPSRSPTPSKTPTPAPVAIIAVSRLSNGYPNIFTMTDTGTVIKQITDRSFDDRPVSLRRNLDSIVFSSNADGAANESDIYKTDQTGAVPVRLTTSLNNGSPSLSSNGIIAFTSTRDGNLEVYKMDSTGSSIGRLTNNPIEDFNPKISGNGAFVVYTTYAASSIRVLYLVRIDGTGTVKLADQATDISIGIAAAFNPANTKVIFYMHHPSGTDQDGVYSVNVDGSGLTPLFLSTDIMYDMSISPDGGSILYIDSSANLNKVGMDGSNKTVISSSVYSVSY